MLKRFMNWLLNKLQTLFGSAGSKRRPNEPIQPDETIKPIDRLIRSRATESLQTLRRNQSLPSPQNQPEPSSQPSVGTDIDAAQVALPLLDGLPVERASTVEIPGAATSDPSSSPEAPIGTRLNSPTNVKPDTHKRLDATSSALDGAGPVRPTFPSEVSDLLSSSSTKADPADANVVSTNVSDVSDVAVRSLKKVPSAQLPDIHDLLPAVEDVPEAQADPAPLSAASEVLSASKTSKDNIVDEGEDSVESLPPAISTSPVPEQAVLFSFDITESEHESVIDQPDVNERADSVSLEKTLEDSSSDVSINLEQSDEALERAQSERENAGGLYSSQESTVSPIDSSVTDLSPQVPSPDLLLDEVVSGGTDKISDANTVSELPYPWSLAGENKATSDISQVDTDAEKSDWVQSDSVKPVEPVEQKILVKEGVVKLLFTLKQGNFHGYIAPEDGTKDILFHEKYINEEVFPQLDRGVKVTASVKYVEGKAYATHVNLLQS